MKKVILLSLLLCASGVGRSDTIEVNRFKYAGPFPVTQPFMVDTVDVNSKPYSGKGVIDRLVKKRNAKDVVVSAVPHYDGGRALNNLSFKVNNTSYATGKLNVEGVNGEYAIFIDGKKSGDGAWAFSPATHEVDIQYISSPESVDSIKVTLVSDKDGVVTINDDNKRLYAMSDVLLGKRISSASLSPDGKFMIIGYATTRAGGRVDYRYELVNVADGNTKAEFDHSVRWLPKTNKLYFERNGVDGRQLLLLDPVTNATEVWVDKLPEGSFTVSPDETYLLYTTIEEGPAEDPKVYQVLNPEDRQEGWRSRVNVAKYDIASGVMQPLTFGYHNAFPSDISSDGRYILLQVMENRFTKRPTTLWSLYRLDVNTLKSDLLVEKDGFIGTSTFSPDGKQIMITGSPEAFEGIGNTLAPGLIPNMTENEIFLMDIDTKIARCLTKDFDPSISRAAWSQVDGNIYFTAEDKDSVNIFRLNPSTLRIDQLPIPEEVVNSFSLARTSPLLAAYGVSASNSQRLYTYDTKSNKATLKEDLSARILDGVTLGECKSWTFKNDRGDTIYGRYILPPDFDPAKKYPMIVNYYGGCSPTSRNFESRYPHHAYAAQGYVALVLQPSGATGFGQEFASRHVNTAGEGPAQDIIQGTKQFVAEHPWVDAEKIGCIGASYGGFMSQYLQTLTDIFAAAISHAGISDHTSYWGEGYWGYSYSEVSMADSYPWTRKDLYVDRSPLYNADKIHTPILFLHGDADMNVPFGESIQMFTALQLLGRETAFVAVADQEHHILDYDKRLKWQDTIFAWFAKYLKDDPTWWNALYPPKSL